MNIEVLSGVPLADITQSELVARLNGAGGNIPMGIPRQDMPNHLLYDKRDFAYSIGAVGLQNNITLQVQAGYKRLVAFALLTRTIGVGDDYELGVLLNGEQAVNSVSRQLLESNAVTPVAGRWNHLHRAVHQSTIEVSINIPVALTAALNGQIVFMLSKV